MLNIIWAVMLLVPMVYSFFAGTAMEVSEAVFESCADCVSFILKTGSVMIMWSGFMNIAKVSQLTNHISRILSPVIRFVFKGINRGSEEEKLISASLSANMLGLSNAATPLGIEAMKKLSEKSKHGIATNDMCMLCIVNCASIQLVPSTLIALRSAQGSASPSDIIVPIWIASFMTVVFAVSVAKLFERRDRLG